MPRPRRARSRWLLTPTNTTKRDLSGMGGVLFVGLLGVIVASVFGMFVQLPLLYIGISAVAAVLFTGFLVFDLNRVANTPAARAKAWPFSWRCRRCGAPPPSTGG
jgi:FtsH-binding integral membrane protein